MQNLYNTKNPVLLLIWKRADSALKVLDEVRKARPARIYISGDGPRPYVPTDYEECVAARQAMLDAIDWNCEVITNFLDKNLGCRLAVSSGITWFFSKEDQGIILEDDCVPVNSFFRYCDTLLERYKTDTRVSMICGANLCEELSAKQEYFFSKYAFVWGWASWKRAWQLYDVEMKTYPEFLSLQGIKTSSRFILERFFWKRIFDNVHEGLRDTWDYQWLYTCMATGSLCTVPTHNLIKNIGFGPGAVRTVDVTSPFADLKVYDSSSDFAQGPRLVYPNYSLDRKLFYTVFLNIANVWVFIKSLLHK